MRIFQDVLNLLCIVIIIIWVFVLITGCSFAVYTDGDVKAYGAALGTNKALDGLQYMKSKEGTQLQVKGLSTNQTEGLTAIVEGAVAGALKGVKP